MGYYALSSDFGGSGWVEDANFGQNAFAYTVPSGFQPGIY